MSNGDNDCMCKPNHFPETTLPFALCKPCSFFDINSTADLLSGFCKCKPNHFNDTEDTKTCQPCVFYHKNAVVNADKTKCVCKTNFINQGNTAKLNCIACTEVLTNSVLSDDGLSCRCRNDFGLIESVCQKCTTKDKNSVSTNKGFCECI